MSASVSDTQAVRVKVAILGFGTVGSSVARILSDAKPQGVELTHIFNRSVARKRTHHEEVEDGGDEFEIGAQSAATCGRTHCEPL